MDNSYSMRRSSLTIIGIIALLLSPLEAYLLYNGALFALGYEFADSPEELAEQLIEEQRPSEDCFLFRTMDIGPRPTTRELQERCVYAYASRTKDARDCEPLMPSSYGSFCIGSAQDWPYGVCFMTLGSDELRCVTPEAESQYNEYVVTQIDDCDAYEEYDNRSVVLWCLAERANVHGELEPCLAYAQSDEERDTCRYLRATNLDDVRPDVCETISNTSIRLGCATEVKAWITYPELLEDMRQYRRWVNE